MGRIAPNGALAPGEFRAAAASAADWRRTTKACLDRLGSTGGANLGFLYIGDRLADDAGSILTLLRQITGIEAWVGTVAVGVLAGESELFDLPAIAVMLARLPEDGFRLVPRFDTAAAALAPAVAGWVAATPPALGLVHADPRNPHLPALLTGLAERSGAFLVGGLTSSRGAYSQICGGLTEGAASAVLFGPAVPVMTGLSQGCAPIGPGHIITACHDNVIEEIDDRPALEVFKAEVGAEQGRDLRRAVSTIFAALPVAGADTPDYMVRHIIGIDAAQGWIAITDLPHPGDRLLFTRRDRAGAVQDLDRMLADIKRRLAGRQPRGALYVSCLARGPNLFGEESEELRQVQSALGGVPLVGFFANGEVSHDRIYGHTGVLTLFL